MRTGPKPLPTEGEAVTWERLAMSRQMAEASRLLVLQ